MLSNAPNETSWISREQKLATHVVSHEADMSQPTIIVEGLGKVYRIGHREPPPTGWWPAAKAIAGAPFRYLREVSRPPTEAETLWALREVSFTVERGEVVGIVGHNGAGKSTLLKILSRITEPTEGRAVINGRIGSLLEIGTGFHPDLTGRENVYLNGAILGMHRHEIEAKFDEIVAFSEIEKFIDTPVKRYSSGMYVRLAFAVASHLEPEVLILDEVLSVGDAAFRSKCQDKMAEVARNGRTVLFVSHNMGAVQTLCPRAIWFDHGVIKMQGPSEEIVSAYLLSSGRGSSGPAVLKSWADELSIERVRVLDEAGEETTSVVSGSSITIEADYYAREPVIQPYLWIGIAGHTGHLFTANMLLDGQRPERLEGRGRIRCRFSKVPLVPRQSYQVLMGAIEKDGFTNLMPRTEVATFSISGAPASVGYQSENAERAIRLTAPILVPYQWEVDDGFAPPIKPARAHIDLPAPSSGAPVRSVP